MIGFLSKPESELLRRHETTIKSTQSAFVMCGKALIEIRDSKLYREKFGTFEEYCKKRWGWGQERARLLIEGAAIALELPPECESILQNEGQARALGKAPKEARPEILKTVANNGHVTAKKIEIEVSRITEGEARKSPTIVGLSKDAKPVKIITRDETGYAIPETALPLWNRRQEVKDILRAISTARAALKTVMDARKDGGEDMLFAAANINGAWGRLSDAWTTVSMALPYAVCPTCQGRAPDNCLLCKGRSFISKHIYDSAVSIELKAVRDKSCVRA